MGLHSYFMGLNVNPKVSQPYVPQSVFNYIQVNYDSDVYKMASLMSVMSIMSGGKHWGYLTSDVQYIWESLFKGIMEDPANQHLWESEPVLYVVFYTDDNQVFYWKVTVPEKKIQLFLGNKCDPYYTVISPALSRHKTIPIKAGDDCYRHISQKSSSIYESPSREVLETMEYEFESMSCTLHHQRLWYCIYNQEDVLFQEHKFLDIKSYGDDVFSYLGLS